jgi:transcriptional regulator with GAF, ATPase, and Fis domain
VDPASPLLLVIAGPARGRSVPIDKRLSIGRGDRSDLAIADVALSRQHCELEPTGEGVVLRDLGSLNGSWVNGQPVNTHILSDGDQIRIGDSALLFIQPAARQPAADTSDEGALDDTPVSIDSTLAIETATARYVQPAADTSTDPTRAARDLTTLLRLSEALHGATSRDELHTLLLEHALRAVPADVAAVLAADAATGALSVAALTHRTSEPVVISRTIARRALSDRSAVLTNQVGADVRLGSAASIAGSTLRAALAVPLLTAADPTSVLYLGRGAAAAGFTEDDLEVVAGIGSIGGLALDRLRHLEWLEDENTRLRQDIAIDHQMIGESRAMQRVYRFIERTASTDATVLIRGESGTGKELVARAVHANSPRSHGPFVAINCAALPEALLESELFGHERGAFTGAVGQLRGRLELADRGTVFLDEIGELATTLQAKLLRVLQDRVIERIGGRRAVPIDIRLIAATNRDLDRAIADGHFRRDLYYRLNVVSIEVPALKTRREDIPLLAAYFVRKYSSRCKRSVKGISPEARALLMRYDWPGNVRELENAIERAVVLGSTDVIHVDDLPEALLERASEDAAGTGFHERVAAEKRAIIKEALERAGGNVAQAARDLGLQPTYLHRLIRNLEVRQDRASPDLSAEARTRNRA